MINLSLLFVEVPISSEAFLTVGTIFVLNVTSVILGAKPLSGSEVAVHIAKEFIGDPVFLDTRLA